MNIGFSIYVNGINKEFPCFRPGGWERCEQRYANSSD
jgi:hypothetical protein